MDEQEFTEMVRAIRAAEKSMGTVDYTLTDKQAKGKDFSRSLYVVADVAVGAVFTHQNVRSIRPGFGLHPKFLPEILGKRAKIALKKGDRFHMEMVQ